MGSVVKGLFGSKSKPAQSSNPAWLDAAGSEIYQKGLAETQRPYTPYTGQRVANLSENQLLAEQNAKANLGRFKDRFSTIENLLGQVGQQYNNRYNPNTVNARDVGTQNFTQANLSGYMDPYLKNVLDPQLEDMREQNAIDVNKFNQQAAYSGNFGGSRQALQEDLMKRRQDKGLQNVTNQAYSNAFGNAQNMFTSDQGRQLQADLANQGKDIDLGQYNENMLKNAFDTNYGVFKDNRDANLTAAQALGDFTNLQRDISTKTNDDLMRTGAGRQLYDQSFLDNLYNNFRGEQDYNRNNLDWLSNLVNTSASRGAVTAPAQKGSSGIGEMIGTGLQMLPMFLSSDFKLKEDLVKVGEKDGINIYEYSYKDNPEHKYQGVVAQEVEHIPGAVITDEDGYKKVDYSKIPVEFKQLA